MDIVDNYKCTLSKNGAKRYYYGTKPIKAVEISKPVRNRILCPEKAKATVGERVGGFNKINITRSPISKLKEVPLNNVKVDKPLKNKGDNTKEGKVSEYTTLINYLNRLEKAYVKKTPLPGIRRPIALKGYQIFDDLERRLRE